MVDYYVSTNGLDEDNGGILDPFLTIAKAAEVTSPGDIVYIREGVYSAGFDRVENTINSGSTEGHIKYTNYNDEEVIVRKGKSFSDGWVFVSDNPSGFDNPSDFNNFPGDGNPSNSDGFYYRDFSDSDGIYFGDEGREGYLGDFPGVAGIKEAGIEGDDNSGYAIPGSLYIEEIYFHPIELINLDVMYVDYSNKRIYLRLSYGYPSDVYIVDNTHGRAFATHSSYIEFDGLIIEYSYEGFNFTDDKAGGGATHIIVKNCDVRYMTGQGVYTSTGGVSDCVFDNNHFYYTGRLFYYSQNWSSWILNSEHHSFYINSCHRSVFSNNICEKCCGIAIYMASSLSTPTESQLPKDEEIYYNYAEGVMFRGKNLDIHNNIFIDNPNKLTDPICRIAGPSENIDFYDNVIINNISLGKNTLQVGDGYGENVDFSFNNNIVITNDLVTGDTIFLTAVEYSSLEMTGNLYYGSHLYHAYIQAYLSFDTYKSAMYNTDGLEEETYAISGRLEDIILDSENSYSMAYRLLAYIEYRDSERSTIYNGETIAINTSHSFAFYFENAEDEATINLDGNNYTIGSSDALNFIWDKGGDPHTFTTVGETIDRFVNGRAYSVIYEGEGTHLFTIVYEWYKTVYEWYKTVSDLINDAQVRGEDIVAFVDKMATDLNSSEIPSDDIHKEKLEAQINSTSNRLSLNNISYTTQLLNFVEALQGYITEEYGSVDEFLSDNKIKVKTTFADISEEVGYTILPSNISDVS